jgi:hypothetical protein
MTESIHASPEPNLIFLHSRLDEYGLSAPQFRVYAHMARRSNLHGSAWPAIESMARICRLHPRTVRSAIRELIRRNMITCEPRTGATTLYRLTQYSQWRPSVEIDCHPLQTGTAVSDCSARSAKAMHAHPSQSDTDKGNPAEGNPEKEIHIPPKSPKGDRMKGTSVTSVQEEEIYVAYPKQVGKPAALRAIRRALAKYPSDFLLERTRLYAITCNSPVDFIPHPSTWFNQERFNDDPATWRRSVGSNGKPQPAIIRPDKFGCGASKL